MYDMYPKDWAETAGATQRGQAPTPRRRCRRDHRVEPEVPARAER
jgi:hypothetical protein